MTFETNRKEVVQEQFQIIEIDIVSIAGACTLTGTASDEGYYTPLTCIQQLPQAVETHYFASENMPVGFGRSVNFGDGAINIQQPIHRVIKSISENTTQLKPSEGLSGRGSLSVSFADFIGDPGFINTTTDGTFFGKFSARNVLNNREIRLKYFHVKSDGVYTAADALTKTYKIDSLSNDGKGRWTLKAKDELTKTDKDKSQFPQPTGGSLRLDIDAVVTAIPVDDEILYAVNDVVFISGEFMRVTGVSNIQTSTASLTVAARGSDIVGLTSLVDLTTTIAEPHSANDAIQICHESDDERIDDFLTTVLTSVDVDAARIPSADWLAEVDEWHNGVRLNTLWFEPEDSNKVIKSILIAYLMDMWYEATDREIKLSAISVWKLSSVDLREGFEIDYETLKTKPSESLRFSRAHILHNKPSLSENNDIENYKEVTVFKDLTLESSGRYGEPKSKKFDPSPIISKTSAQLLTQRFVSRFGFTPITYSWTTQERFLNFKTGDIVNITSNEIQDFDGSNKIVRAQILKVLPKIGKVGRSYNVKALTYEAAFSNGSEFTLTGTNCEIDLHTIAGAPSQPVNLTFVFDGGIYCSQTFGVPSVKAGNFAAGSKITIILKSGANWQSLGGAGGAGGSAILTIDSDGLVGVDGGYCYDAQGIDTDIYLSGVVGAHTALGDLRAAGGGGGGSQGIVYLNGVDNDQHGGNGGGGGAGYDFGLGGAGGAAETDEGAAFVGTSGDSGDNIGSGGSGKTFTVNSETSTSGAGGDWGEDGLTGTAELAGTTAGGLAGKGVVDNGATVCVFGATIGVNFINGSGDTPCYADATPVISGISSGTPTDEAVTIVWTTDIDADSEIEYGLTTGYGSTTGVNALQSTAHGFTITGLTASTLYNFKVKSETSTSMLAESANQTFTTDSSADVTAPIISSVFTSGILSTSFAVTWTTDEGADTQIEYGLTNAYGSTTGLNTSLVTSHSQTIGGLTASTLYYYRVLSRDSAGNLATGIERTETTAASGGEVVSYPGATVISFNASPATSEAGIRFKKDGTVQKSLDSVLSSLHDWVAPKNSAVGDDYEIRATKQSGADPSTGTLNTWQVISADRIWSNTVTTAGVSNSAVRDTVLLIEIRDVATSTVQESQNYTITAEAEGNL